MSNPYEIDHNISSKEASRARTRRPSMSSFFSQLAQVESTTTFHNNLHALPTPVDMAAAERLLQDQLLHFLSMTSSTQQSDFLQSLIRSIDQDIDQPPTTTPGVSQNFLDQLERVSRSSLKKGEECKICGEEFLDDEYSLVVQLPCHPLHRFDLECVGPWLRLQGTCPLDRKNLEEDRTKRLNDLIRNCHEVEEEDFDDMYA
ncbi:hypothetical protein HI914_02907 [Erysiphe necator]|uniref:RING-type domain-containing protein n=1 Tax=Uncinula necator TaxID=52586 RepID=A0A0B1P5F3_UNCNE|nr:hypothetical protein HI914_02907 [Erysiphe necator]KHJ31879.1 hypothetical protein EV44_g2658 [Erysiphe necator]